MLYTKMFAIPCSLSNHQDTVASDGAGHKIQDDVQDGCHKYMQVGVLNDLLYWLTSFEYTKQNIFTFIIYVETF